mmetsp:Transcript_10909/g.13184  ORF Transcript_10909/g.13184 Transcript_10909/m.13184 type:complete len:93 (+) Transcript_10909:627-905(+)
MLEVQQKIMTTTRMYKDKGSLLSILQTSWLRSNRERAKAASFNCSLKPFCGGSSSYASVYTKALLNADTCVLAVSCKLSNLQLLFYSSVSIA